MKSIQELYTELLESNELREKLMQAANADKLGDFLKEQGCDATVEDAIAFFEEKAAENKPLSLDELDDVAGGDVLGEIVKGGVNVVHSLVVFGCIIRSIQHKDDEVCQVKPSGVEPIIDMPRI